MRGGSIGRFSPSRGRGGSGLGAAETGAASAKTLRGKNFPAQLPVRAPLLTDEFLTSSRASLLYRSFLYAVIVFISFFLMLVFMTYNVRCNAHLKVGRVANAANSFPPRYIQAYLILATVAGAGIGHYLFSEFGAEGEDKGMACH